MNQETDNRPLMVSIRCITYNHEPYIRQCLEGFVMQKTNFRFEAIVHDDASTDGTADIIREYAEKYPDIIKPIFETENQYSKHDESLPRIMDEACKGKYIAFCEGDDYWTDPTKLQKQYDALETNIDCVAAFNRVNLISVTGELLNKTIPEKGYLIHNKVTLYDFVEIEYRQNKWALHTSSFFVRKEMLKKACEYKKTIFKNYIFGDLTMILTCLLSGKGYIIQQEMGCYRYLAGVMSKKRSIEECVVMDIKSLDFFMNLDAYTDYKYTKEIQNPINKYYSALRYNLFRDTKYFNSKYLSAISNCSKPWKILFTFLYLRYIICPISKIRIKMALGNRLSR